METSPGTGADRCVSLDTVNAAWCPKTVLNLKKDKQDIIIITLSARQHPRSPALEYNTV